MLRHARQHNLPFNWQTRYHDLVIRSAGEHESIQRYVLVNPQTREEDSLMTSA